MEDENNNSVNVDTTVTPETTQVETPKVEESTTIDTTDTIETPEIETSEDSTNDEKIGGETKEVKDDSKEEVKDDSKEEKDKSDDKDDKTKEEKEKDKEEKEKEEKDKEKENEKDQEKQEKEKESDLKRIENLNKEYELRRLSKLRNKIDEQLELKMAELKTEPDLADATKEKIGELKVHREQVLKAQKAFQKGEIDEYELARRLKACDNLIKNTYYPGHYEEFNKEVEDEIKEEEYEMDSTANKDSRKKDKSKYFRGNNKGNRNDSRNNNSRDNNGEPTQNDKDKDENTVDNSQRPPRENRGGNGQQPRGTYQPNPYVTNGFGGGQPAPQAGPQQYPQAGPQQYPQGNGQPTPDGVQDPNTPNNEEKGKSISFDDIMYAKTTTARNELLSNLTPGQKIRILESTANTKIEKGVQEPKRSWADVFKPDRVIEKRAELNKAVLRKATQAHLVSAKAQSELMMKGYIKELENIDVVEPKNAYAMKDPKFKLIDVVDEENINDKVTGIKAFGRATKHFTKEAIRNRTGSRNIDQIMKVTNPKEEFKDVYFDDLKPSQKEVEIYQYTVPSGKYDSVKLADLEPNEEYKKYYDKYMAELEEAKKADPEAKLSVGKQRFVNTYEKYSQNIEVGKFMDEVTKVYEERHQPYIPSKEKIKQLSAAKEKFDRQAGLDYSNPEKETTTVGKLIAGYKQQIKENNEKIERENNGTYEPRNDEPIDNGPRDNGPRDNGPRDNGPRDNGPRDNGPRDNGPRDNGPRDNGPRDNGPRNNGPRNNGPRDNGPRNNGPRNNGPRDYDNPRNPRDPNRPRGPRDTRQPYNGKYNSGHHHENPRNNGRQGTDDLER